METFKKIKNRTLMFFMVLMMATQIMTAFIPLSVSAQAGSGIPTSNSSFNVSKYLTTKDQGNKYLKSKNPIASAIVQFINLLVLTIGSVSFLAVIVGGFTYVVSHGNENLVNKAKEIITYAILGLVIALSAYFIVAFVQNIFYEI